jgi:hypothetical protein
MGVKRVEFTSAIIKAAVTLQVYPTWGGMRRAITLRRRKLERCGFRFASVPRVSGEISAYALLFHASRLKEPGWTCGELFTCAYRVGRRYPTDMLHEIVHFADFVVGSLASKGIIKVPRRARKASVASVLGEYRACIVEGLYAHFVEWRRVGCETDKMRALDITVFPDLWRKKK